MYDKIFILAQTVYTNSEMDTAGKRHISQPHQRKHWAGVHLNNLIGYDF